MWYHTGKRNIEYGRRLAKKREVLHQFFDSYKDSFTQQKPFAMFYCFNNKNKSFY